MNNDCRSFASCLAAIAFLLASVAQASFAAAKVVAIADVGDESERDLAVFESAVRDAGFELRKIKGRPEILAKPETYDGIDAIVFGIYISMPETCAGAGRCREIFKAIAEYLAEGDDSATKSPARHCASTAAATSRLLIVRECLATAPSCRFAAALPRSARSRSMTWL